MASVGYGDTPILQRLNLRLDPDDRIALLGRNGNGKTTLARLLAAQLTPMDGRDDRDRARCASAISPSIRSRNCDRDETPLEHMTRADEGREARGGARASSAGSAFRATRRRPRSASCRAASARGWRWR